jgi:hypothetical protein
VVPPIAAFYARRSHTFAIGIACVHSLLAVPLLMVAFWTTNAVAQSDAFCYVFLHLFGLSNGLALNSSITMLTRPVSLQPLYPTGDAASTGFAFLQLGVLLGMVVGMGLSSLSV